MTTQRQIDANRKNSAKSTGPKTPEGLERSSLNAIVHGLRSKKIALAREDSYAFENRRHKWLASADAGDDREEFLVYLSVCQSFCIEHAQRAQVERVSSLIENYDENELDEVYRLGKRLFHDSTGPTTLYGIDPYFRPQKEERRPGTERPSIRMTPRSWCALSKEAGWGAPGFDSDGWT